MTDPPEVRLQRARAVELYLEYQLGLTRDAIRRLEAEVAEQERRREVAYRESRFTIQHAASEDMPDTVHRGGCRKNQTARDFYRPQELASVLGTRRVDACELCNPMPGLHGAWMPRMGGDEGA